MRKLTITFLTIVFCLTSSIAFSETVKPDDLVERNELTYKKFSNKPYSGVAETYFYNGQLNRIETYKDGKKEGVEEWYDENGSLSSRITFKDGKRIKEENFY